MVEYKKGGRQGEKYRGKEALWSAVSFIAPDQLRQRVAFALLQLLVVSQEGLGKGDETEVWLTYYDISKC